MTAHAGQENIAAGPWKDYASNRSYILWREQTTVMTSIAVAVTLTLTSPRFLVLLRRLVLHNTKRKPPAIPLQNRSRGAEIAETVNEALDNDPAVERAAFRIWADYVCIGRIQLPTSLRSPLSSCLSGPIDNFKNDPLRTTMFAFTSATLFTLFVCYQAIAVCANRIVGPGIATSANPHAGAWYPGILDRSLMENTSTFPAMTDFHTELMFKAVAYADNCYTTKGTERECGLFYRPRIDYQETHNASCPFEDEMCLIGRNGAYELDTRFLDAKILGINDKHTVSFRLRKVCAPLTTRERFVQVTPTGGNGAAVVEYHYGDGWGIIREGNQTFRELVPSPKAMQHDQPHYFIK
ncbi:hypothetical protein BDV95DRAFT_252406 [Massariosphaeria phaeospora]|uniref:Uncharacterized protein n=1 Tax=Massariosphaeria phaeospora TaxID=100035 RepID=A0A7C8I1N4_9PLEO|nr:hypothetical protein BDV95DRAFT_252406 [Massariosphaeria phaeospora]